MQTIPIDAFFDTWNRDLTLQRQAHATERMRLKAEVDRLERLSAQLTSDMGKKTTLRTHMAAEGLPTTDLEAQLEHMREVLAATKNDEDQARTRLEAQAPLSATAKPTIDRLREQLIEIGCDAATVFPDLVSLYRWLPLSFPNPDTIGRPTRVRAHLGSSSELDIPIVAGDRILRDHLPRELNWLPRTAPQKSQREAHAFHAVYIEASQQRLLTSNRFNASRAESEFQYGERSYTTYQIDCSHLALTILDDIQLALQPVSTPLLLDGHYEPDSIADVLRDRVVAATTTEPEFRPSTIKPTSAEVERTISAQWAAFVQCPWHAGVTRQLALLKYLAERGEQPRFWAEPFENHYGFRLRTRDHDWLVGDLYVAETVGAANAGIEVHESSEWGYAVASLGSLSLRVTLEK